MAVKSYPVALFTRQQIGAFTGIETSALNQWIREGILRPAVGGSGKGNHRKFAYHQVTLAGILGELRSFGIGTPALGRLADRFHEALAWMSDRGISRRNVGRIYEAWTIKREIAADGGYMMLTDEAEAEQIAPGHRLERDEHGFRWLTLSWEEVCQVVGRQRASKGRVFLQPDERDLVASWRTKAELDEFGAFEPYFEALTEIDLRPVERISREEEIAFYRTEDKDWLLMSNNISSPVRTSYIGLNPAALAHRIWSPYFKEAQG